MLVDPSNSTAASAVTGAIREASQATGTSFNYLLATAQVESGLNPQAGAATSSARGLFQFIEQTWLGTLKASGSDLGYGRYAAAITADASGHYQVSDPTLRAEILKLRDDPTANAVMAGAFTKANAEILSKKLGRSPSEGELYVAHFLGVGGASQLISLAAANPGAKAASYFPTAARANSSIFFDHKTGAPRSLAQVRDILTARYDVAARSGPGAPIGLAQMAALAATQSPGVSAVPATAMASAAVPAPTAAAAVPDTAGMTSAFAAAVPRQREQSNDVFHGLFQDTDRPAPIAAVVSQLWGVASAAPKPGAQSAQPSASGNLLDLFRDPAAGA